MNRLMLIFASSSLRTHRRLSGYTPTTQLRPLSPLQLLLLLVVLTRTLTIVTFLKIASAYTYISSLLFSYLPSLLLLHPPGVCRVLLESPVLSLDMLLNHRPLYQLVMLTSRTALHAEQVEHTAII